MCQGSSTTSKDHNVSTAPSPDRPARRYQPLLVVLGAVCLGIFVDRHGGVGLGTWWAVTLAGSLAWFVLRRLGRDRAACVLLLLAAGATAGAWHHLRWSRFAVDDLGTFASARGQPACLEAVVAKGSQVLPAPPYDPMRVIPRDECTQLELCVERIRDGLDWRSASGRTTLMVSGRRPGIRAGDRVRVFGRLAATRHARNPGQSNQAEHLRGDRVRARLWAGYPACVTVIERAGGWQPARWLEAIQNRAGDELARRLDPRHAGLASALVLGNREDLGPSRSTAFRESGMAHLLAVSGLHVGIIVLGLAWALRLLRVPRVPAVVLVMLAAVAYTILTGARPPAVRASILVVVLSIGILSGRHPARFNALAAAALVVLALNPADLFRTGPQLSFLAVAAIMWVAPNWVGSWKWKPDAPLERLVDAARPWWSRWFRGGLRSTGKLLGVSAVLWLALLPLVTARFHLVAPAAIFLNVLLWIPMTMALCSGFLVLTLGWLVPPLGAAAGWVCNESLALIDWTVHGVQRVPWGHCWVPGPAPWWLWGFYGGALVVALAGRWRPPRRWLVALAAGWVGIGLLSASWPARSERLGCTFLAVGHGLAVVLELPDGRAVLYDAGSMTSPYGAARSITGCLWDQGITRLDAVVLSHADADHYNALPGVLQRMPVGVVYVPPTMFSDESRPLRALREAIAAAGVPIRELVANDRLDGGQSCRIEVLHPLRHGPAASDNAGSMVLLIEYAGRRILLPGDLEPPGLDDVLAEEPIDCDVILVPHHGSRRSSPPGLMAWCRPEWAVISGSLAREPKATEDVYRAASVRVLHTGRAGAVRVEIDASGRLCVTSAMPHSGLSSVPAN